MIKIFFVPGCCSVEKLMSMQGGKGMRRRKSVDLTSSTHASNSSLVPGSSEKDVKCPRRKLIELLP